MKPDGNGKSRLTDTLRMVAWEITRSCNLACVHCRASSLRGPYAGELTTDEGKRLLDDIAGFSSPVIILTGGEPLLRPDIYELAAYGDWRRNGAKIPNALDDKIYPGPKVVEAAAEPAALKEKEAV